MFPAFRISFDRLAPLLCLGLSVVAHAASGVDDITSLEATPPFSVRHHALHGLSSNQLESGATQLIDFMREQQVPAGMRPVDYMSLVNDSFNRLVEHHIRAEELLRLILDVIPDDTADEVWRDYAVQKLGYTLDRGDISRATLDAGFGMLERAAQGEFPRVQGTALIVALKLSESQAHHHGFLRKGALGEMALAGVKDTSKHLIDRVTALQVAGLCGNPEALHYARTVLNAQNRSTDETMLLVSAIAVIGEQGRAEDKTIIAEHRLAPDIRVRSASRSALSKIELRNK